MLYEVSNKINFYFIRYWNNNNKLSYIVHNIHKGYITVSIDKVVCYPEISVKYYKRWTNRPREHDFLTSLSPFIYQHTVWALLCQDFNVYSHIWLEELKFQYVQRFILSHITRSRWSIHEFKHNTSKKKGTIMRQIWLELMIQSKFFAIALR